MPKPCAHSDEIPSSLRIHRQRIVLGIPCNAIWSPATSDLAPIPGFTEIFCSADDSLDFLPFHQDPLFTEVTAIEYTSLSEAELLDAEYVPRRPCLPLDPCLTHSGPDGTTQTLPLPGSSSSFEHLSTVASLESGENLSDCGRKRFVLSFSFRAKINNLPEGLYRAQERASWDQEDWTTDVDFPSAANHLQHDLPPVLATAFEQLFARRTFPTIDYPFMKTIFELSVVLRHCSNHDHITALSSTAPLPRPSPYLRTIMHELEFPPSTLAQSFKVISFAPTPRIGAYSLSLFVSDFLMDSTAIATSWGRNYSIEVALARSSIARTKFALWPMRMAARLLRALSARVFARDPMLGSEVAKITLVPLLLQRGIGLENHGCISLKEDYFFVDGSSSVSRVLRIARLLVHELAHQWIGNTYTPMPLDQIWMKEGLTRCLEFTTLDYVFNGSDAAKSALWAVYAYDIKYESILDDIFRGATPFDPPKVNRADVLSRNAFYDPLKRDGSPSRTLGQSCCTMYPAPCLGSHPLSDPKRASVTHEELLLLYDTLAYNKAASLLLMVDAATRKSGALTLWQSAVAYLTCQLESRDTCVFEMADLFEAAGYALLNRKIAGELSEDYDLHLEQIESFKPIRSLEGYELLPTGHVPLNLVLIPWLELKGLPLIWWRTSDAVCCNEKNGSVEMEIEQIPSEVLKDGIDGVEFDDYAWPVPLRIWARVRSAGGSSGRIMRSRFYMSAQRMRIRVVAEANESICEIGVEDGSDGFGHFLFAWESPPYRDPERKGSVVSGISEVLERRVSAGVREAAKQRLSEVLSLRTRQYLCGNDIDEKHCNIIWDRCSRLCNSTQNRKAAATLVTSEMGSDRRRQSNFPPLSPYLEHPVVRMIYGHGECLKRKECSCTVREFNSLCHEELMRVVDLPSSLPPERRASFPPPQWLKSFDSSIP